MVTKAELTILPLLFLLLINVSIGIVMGQPTGTTISYVTPSLNTSQSTINSTTITTTSNSTSTTKYFSNINSKNYGIFGLNINWLVYPFYALADTFNFAFSNFNSPNVAVSILASALSFLDIALFIMFIIGLTPWISS